VKESIAKNKLRQKMKRARFALSDAKIVGFASAGAERVMAYLREACIDPADGYLAAYCAIQNEWTPDVLMAAWEDRGGRCCLPRTDDNRLVFCATDKAACRPRGPLGLPEPPADALSLSPDEIAVLIVPGLAFDDSGYRVGFGAGFYDRFLSNLRRSGRPSPLVIGVGYDFQVIASVPRSDHDEPLDLVITPRKTYRCI